MRVGVLGGGLQGCCVALALAERGADVALFDRNDTLISRAGVANEGRIHLGYMYAGDQTLLTAKRMIRGALAFAPFLERYLGTCPQSIPTSSPAAYVVHRDSQQPPEQVRHYFNRVHDLIEEASQAGGGPYFGMDLAMRPRRWAAAERERCFNSEIAVDAVDTCEVAINPVQVAQLLRQRIAATPRIETRLGVHVLNVVDEESGIRVLGDCAGDLINERFDHVVNALWDGRLALNKVAGLATERPWLHRLKYGVSFRIPKEADRPVSATFVLGPFGEVVGYGGGLTYLTWYPHCMRAISQALTPPDWPTYPPEPVRSRIIAGTLAAMANIVPVLRHLHPETLPEALVKGGTIVAWGETDIDDRQSELHRRYDIGVSSKGRFHSVDPGKLTMAPFFADDCAGRIYGLA
jgi:glycine/D-amino acid oxidase-like deaminating enzyme